jgi:hypothetical protein
MCRQIPGNRCGAILPRKYREPATITQREYPELFQTGETAYDYPIVDGQHPHNLFMELAARYDFQLNAKTRFFLYGGPVGEPALGPTAYPHRASASENPVAMLGHHLQDSTHMSFSVITGGVSRGPVQFEMSTFHGQEPGERRWSLGRGKPDSFATRLTVAPSHHLTGQLSIGRINHRETLDPDLTTLRTTASVSHSATTGLGNLETTAIWGRNSDRSGSVRRTFSSFAFESTLNFKRRNWAWTRIEDLDKDQTILFADSPDLLSIPETPLGRVQAYTFGYERNVYRTAKWFDVGVGFQFTGYGMTDTIKAVYGDHPHTYLMFIHLRPSGNMAAHMRMMHNH